MPVLAVLVCVCLALAQPIAGTGYTWPPWAQDSEDLHFLEHSLNCSRYWQCGPGYETCLYECERCWDNPMWCDGQWAKTFDPRFQGIYGPVCQWPVHMDCNMPVNRTIS